MFGNSKANSLIWSEIKFVRDFMPVLVTRKFDEVPINNECASMETSFFYKRLQENFSVLKGK